MQVGRKIYYELATGNVIQDTGEREGSVIETTIEQDFAVYAALFKRVPETVGVKEFAYGELSQDFRECNGYHVNVTTGLLEFSYPDPNIPDAPPLYQKPLSEEVVSLRAEIELMNLNNIDIWEALIPLIP